MIDPAVISEVEELISRILLLRTRMFSRKFNLAIALFQYSKTSENSFFFETIRILKKMDELAVKDDQTRYNRIRRIFILTKLAFSFIMIEDLKSAEKLINESYTVLQSLLNQTKMMGASGPYGSYREDTFELYVEDHFTKIPECVLEARIKLIHAVYKIQ